MTKTKFSWVREIALVVSSIVVVAFLAVIVLFPLCRGENARIYATRASIAAICTAVETYKMVNGVLPDNLEQLMVSVDDAPPLLIKNRVYDAWGTPFRYTRFDEKIVEVRTSAEYTYTRTNLETFEVRSAGPDKVMDTEDDLTN